MKHFKTISEYCEGISIPQPRHPHFDIRSFEENMPVVISEMPPFRHEFYAIAIKADGDGKAITGHHTDFPKGTTIFFNSPFQIISWDIVPNWKGYYIMFSQDFVAQSGLFSNLLQNFPFLKIDKAIPFEIDESDLPDILGTYQKIWTEYHSDSDDKFDLIEAYTFLLLNYTKRYFLQQVDEEQAEQAIRTSDLKLLTRYQTMIQTSFYENTKLETFANLHSPSYYAQKLNVHPNHLNAVVKSITGLTALNHIHRHLLQLSKSYLAQTELSVKEISYALYFESPSSFSSFFKKNTGSTPLNYREQVIL
ncbi:MAG: AraC family transcriptional regulator [Balneola sp.]|nr:MAG: AraC family transcriptional regulator [Balneola sp.]